MSVIRDIKIKDKNSSTYTTYDIGADATNIKYDNSKNIKQKIDSLTPVDIGAIGISQIGMANGVAGLDANGFVPSSQLPSYVDDVLEYASTSAFPATGETGKIYVALDTNKTYRWGGTEYVEISESLAIGTTSSTAFAGDRGLAIENKIPTSASASNKLATASDIPTTLPASDVYAWAKASTKPTYTASEVGAIPAIAGEYTTGLVCAGGGFGIDCNLNTDNTIGYYTANGPSTSIGAVSTDGTLYSQFYNGVWGAQIAQDYRNGNLFTRGKNNGTWTSWLAVPTIQKSTTDISAGSALTTNSLYVVYEA